MPKLILKAIVSAKSSGAPASEQVLGQVDTAADAQRLSVPAQAQTQYRLVDGKTGQVIKNQTVLRKGTLPPVVQKAELSDDGLSILLTFNEQLAVATAPGSAFALKAGSTALTNTITTSTNGKNGVVLTLNTAITKTQMQTGLSVSYTAPAPGNSADSNLAIQDGGGLDATSFNNLSVFAPYAIPQNQTHTKAFAVATGSQIDITGLGLSDTNVTDLSASYRLQDNDVFRWVNGDAGATGAVDIVKDFVAWNGTVGDKLDITNLLAGGYNTSTSVLSQWVTSITTGQTLPGSSTANSTRIVIDVDGLGAGTVTQTIWLEGVTLSTTDAAVLKNSGVLIA